MSDFTVLRSINGYCLVLDKKRIAGGKPDYRGENVLVDWTTEVEYGPVDDLADENAKLRELVRDMTDAIVDWYDLMDGAFACESVYEDEKFAPLFDRMSELGVDA